MKARRLFKSLDDDETGQISFKEILNHTKDCGFPVFLPVVPVRGEAEVALGVCYKTFLLHRTCMRRAPARPMRACLIAVQELDLRAAPVQCNAKQCFAFQSLDFTLHVAEHRGGTGLRPEWTTAAAPVADTRYTEKPNVSRSSFLPNTAPMQKSCSHYNAFCSMTWLTHISLRTWQQNVTTIMQPLHCNLQAQIPKHPTTTRLGARPLIGRGTICILKSQKSVWRCGAVSILIS